MVKKVSAEFIEFECDKCNSGVFRLNPSAEVLHSNPRQWQHQCTECQDNVYFTKIYPMLMYKGKEFIMAP